MYRYFVSFTHMSDDDANKWIRDMQKWIEDNGNVKNVIIMNFQLLN